MAMNENNADFAFGGAPRAKARGTTLNPLHEAALRLAGMGISRSKEKTRDLVAMLLSHGARAWRHTQPQANVHLHVSMRSGRAPIRIRLR